MTEFASLQAQTQKQGFDELRNEVLDLKKQLAQCVVAKTDGSCESIASIIGNFRIALNGSLGFENAQVTSGGVKLGSLTNSLEAVESQGIFVCGEAVNVDGICGGYNLQWAWSTGYIAGRNAAK